MVNPISLTNNVVSTWYFMVLFQLVLCIYCPKEAEEMWPQTVVDTLHLFLVPIMRFGLMYCIGNLIHKFVLLTPFTANRKHKTCVDLIRCEVVHNTVCLEGRRRRKMKALVLSVFLRGFCFHFVKPSAALCLVWTESNLNVKTSSWSLSFEPCGLQTADIWLLSLLLRQPRTPQVILCISNPVSRIGGCALACVV